MKPYIQQIAERLDDLQPVNGSYIQAIAELLNSLSQAGGNINYSFEKINTSSTALTTLDTFSFEENTRGYFQIKVIGRDLTNGQQARTESLQFYYDDSEAAKSLTTIFGGITLGIR